MIYKAVPVLLVSLFCLLTSSIVFASRSSFNGEDKLVSNIYYLEKRQQDLKKELKNLNCHNHSIDDLKIAINKIILVQSEDIISEDNEITVYDSKLKSSEIYGALESLANLSDKELVEATQEAINNRESLFDDKYKANVKAVGDIESMNKIIESCISYGKSINYLLDHYFLDFDNNIFNEFVDKKISELDITLKKVNSDPTLLELHIKNNSKNLILHSVNFDIKISLPNRKVPLMEKKNILYSLQHHIYPGTEIIEYISCSKECQEANSRQADIEIIKNTFEGFNTDDYMWIKYNKLTNFIDPYKFKNFISNIVTQNESLKSELIHVEEQFNKLKKN